MPYTREFFIGYVTFVFWIGVAFFSAGLMNSHINTLTTPLIQNKEHGIITANLL